MKYYTYPLTDVNETTRLTTKEALTIGGEFVLAMICVPAIIVFSAMIITMIG